MLFTTVEFKILWRFLDAEQRERLIYLANFTDEQLEVFILMYAKGKKAKGVAKHFDWDIRKADQQIDLCRSIVLDRVLNNPKNNKFYSDFYKTIVKFM